MHDKELLTLLKYVIEVLTIGDDVYYALTRNGLEYAFGEAFQFKPESWGNYGYETEADAWAQAPTIEALMRPLWVALGNCDGDDPMPVVSVEYCPTHLDWTAILSSPLTVSARSTSPENAIADLFKVACKAGLIDPTTVALS